LGIDNAQKLLDNIGVNIEQAPQGISAADWAATPQSVRQWAMTLLQRLTKLEERVNQNSRNS
jgi:hypothetical protein